MKRVTNEKACRNLVSAVLLTAMKDFGIDRMKNEVRAFFGSKWGKYLCDIVEVSPQNILRGLEGGKIKIEEEF